jgi:hypothetical protein
MDVLERLVSTPDKPGAKRIGFKKASLVRGRK